MNAYFRCINGCETYPLNEVIYQCKKCGDLLEVVHDVDSLKGKSAEYWRNTFRERRAGYKFPYTSGIWNKKEWVNPLMDDKYIVSLGEGYNPLTPIPAIANELGLSNLWIKHCGNTHTGSFKDLGMTVLVSMVNQMIHKDKKNIKAIACASTGDTSAALSSYGSYAGIPTIVFLPHNKISIAQLVQPISNGSIVLALETDFDGCMKVVQEVTKDNTIYLANSMNSLRIEGQKVVGIETIEQLDYNVPDYFIIPGGNLGNVSALGNGILMMKELGLINKVPRIVLAQAENANPLYLSYKKDFKEFKPVQAKKTLASAIQIGNPVSRDKAIKTLKVFNGIVEQASEQELADASAKYDRYGMFTCPHTGVALAVMEKLVKDGRIEKGSSVVVISTAHGLKFANTKALYHENKLDGLVSKYANTPIVLEPDPEKVRKVLYEKIK
ncbi:MAG TPA: threonine synthase [Spirochaetota bacterium]|nr:threonine synthase [Spirochaetota bacterium]HOM38984.1 threonine synthase [Spirochaetota bacterium]HPQ48356.1 threonine synthase [Spirochaetota bacterium]